jgi:hypothetical protein
VPPGFLWFLKKPGTHERLLGKVPEAAIFR